MQAGPVSSHYRAAVPYLNEVILGVAGGKRPLEQQGQAV